MCKINPERLVTVVMQYNEQSLKYCRDVTNAQTPDVRLAFEKIHGKTTWCGDKLFEQVPSADNALDEFYACTDWLEKAVKRLYSDNDIMTFREMLKRVLRICKDKDFEIPMHYCMHTLFFRAALFFSEKDMTLISRHLKFVVPKQPKGNPFIGVVIVPKKNAPELYEHQELFAALAERVRVVVYIMHGKCEGVDLGKCELKECEDMSNEEIATLVRSDKPHLVINGSFASLDVVKYGVAPVVLQLVGCDAPVFKSDMITHRFMNTEQLKRMDGLPQEIPMAVCHYHQPAKLNMPTEKRLRKDNIFKIRTHFRDFKGSHLLKNTILAMADAHKNVEVGVTFNTPYATMMDIDHPRVTSWWHDMQNAQWMMDNVDLVVDVPTCWSMHHTMVVWMKAHVPIAVVRPVFSTCFSAHSIDMLTMFGLENELVFDNELDLALKVKEWVLHPESFLDIKRRFSAAVEQLPSNQEVANMLLDRIVELGMLGDKEPSTVNDTLGKCIEKTESEYVAPKQLAISAVQNAGGKIDNLTHAMTCLSMIALTTLMSLAQSMR